MNIWILEDNADHLRFMTEALEGIGAKVSGCDNVAGFLKLCDGGKPDLVILDFNLTEGQLDHIAAESPKLNAILTDNSVIISSSALAEHDIRNRMRKYAVVDFIGKPYTSEWLISCVLTLLAPSPQPLRRIG